jgi:predicted RNase H-like HicB family nuclease
MYPACFYPEAKGQFSVIFPDLGGIATYGNNLEDATRMAADLLRVWALEAQRNRAALPAPSPLKTIRPETDSGFTTLIFADLDSAMAKEPEKKVA